MFWLQLSAGRGPVECARAVTLAARYLEEEAKQFDIELNEVERIVANDKGCCYSVLYTVAGTEAEVFAQRWQGSLLWQSESQFRRGHKRKNWFFSGRYWPVKDFSIPREQVKITTCRSQGAGGQHVNTTDSAVQVTHIPTGIQCTVQSQRSQHSNKKLALFRLQEKLDELEQTAIAAESVKRWQQHTALERGNPKRIFKGERFTLFSNDI
ncbi:peptide chain release factor H [Spartinivicinus sp. A2-2]|uniref:Peptide chain release factor H n=1 Tax=Spartinivicinus poritis TaxID=2994640 RepID=A0ABT5UFQ9_9GAMM|nr:peptide chain release factor H [Spartinivicinus sp. A2-2]MDE1465217.1 peptide chain release factor H [Spartinivicinus sp. A2-2]